MRLTKHLLALAAAALATLGLAGTAGAMPIISFDDGPSSASQTGTLAYNGTGGALQGRGIVFLTITGEDTPLNDGVVLTCFLCRLNFDTGPNLSETPVYAFDAGGFFTITGTARQGGTTIATGTLLSGSFDVPSSATAAGSTPTATITFDGSGIDTKSPALAAFFGLAGADFRFGTTQISAGRATVNRTPGSPSRGAFGGRVTNADTDNVAEVPEPATLGLLGTGLLGLGLLARRRRRDAADRAPTLAADAAAPA